VQLFLDVRTAVLNDTLEDAFRHRYLGFHPISGDEVVVLRRNEPTGLYALAGNSGFTNYSCGC
jgi:hypothetical protein